MIAGLIVDSKESSARRQITVRLIATFVIFVGLFCTVGYADETPNQRRKRLGLSAQESVPGERTGAAVNEEWEDPKITLARLSKRAAQGDAKAQYDLAGWYHQNGDRSPDREKKRNALIRKSAEGGHIPAMMSMCMPSNLSDISSIPRERLKEAVIWCRRLSSNGYGCKECAETADGLERYLNSR